MSQVVGLTSNSYKPITNMAWVRARLCKLQKRCTRLATTSDQVYQLLAHVRWFSPGTPASSTTKTGRYDIAEILLKMALMHEYTITLYDYWTYMKYPGTLRLIQSKAKRHLTSIDCHVDTKYQIQPKHPMFLMFYV